MIKASIPDPDTTLATFGKAPTDPYFPLQWYLRNTGQNGGKVRLDLNVQAAWDQGYTGKNITTAIMDDGNYIFLNFFVHQIFNFCINCNYWLD